MPTASSVQRPRVLTLGDDVLSVFRTPRRGFWAVNKCLSAQVQGHRVTRILYNRGSLIRAQDPRHAYTVWPGIVCVQYFVHAGNGDHLGTLSLIEFGARHIELVVYDAATNGVSMIMNAPQLEFSHKVRYWMFDGFVQSLLVRVFPRLANGAFLRGVVDTMRAGGLDNRAPIGQDAFLPMLKYEMCLPDVRWVAGIVQILVMILLVVISYLFGYSLLLIVLGFCLLYAMEVRVRKHLGW